MLDKRIYELEYVKALQDKYKRDPGLIERVLYAFGLLEALQQSGMPFCFKGGTSLMLLMEHPMRLSTDIDIIVQPGTDIDKYIIEAGKVFPFLRCEEQIRIWRNKIEKRHFKFIYHSPIRKDEFYILLDILFGEIPYVETIEKEIKNELLLTTGTEIRVVMPSADCILGDKLTAFAPHTTGIPIGVGKSLEIAKQLFDVATLTDVMKNYETMRCTYNNAVVEELAFRGLDIEKDEVLMDTINACISIIGRGTLEKEDYPEYIAGIQSAATHIIAYKYSGEIAAQQACKVMYLVAGLLKNKAFERIENPEIYMNQTISNTKYKKLSGIKKQKLEAYGYLCEAVRLLNE